MSDIRTRINRVLSLIETEEEQPLTLEDLADAGGISPWHFVRVFRSLVGETPVAYQARRRLARAARGLAATDRRILEIAIDLGFSSQESFHRAFFRHFGTTPGRYRLQMRDHQTAPTATRIPVLRDFPLEPRITAQEPLVLEGTATRVRKDQNNLPYFTALWEEFFAREIGPKEVLYRETEAHAHFRFDQETGEGLYTIGWFKPRGAPRKQGTAAVEFPCTLWARFDGTPETVDPLVRYAWGDWLADSGHRAAGENLGHIESHRFGRFESPWDHRVWVPLGTR